MNTSQSNDTQRPAIDTLGPVTLEVTADAILAYAELTNDYNPIHLDPEFARTTAMGGVIAHGTMSLNLMWQALAQGLGDAAVLGGTLQVRFQRPVRIGQQVTARGTALPETPGAYAIWVENNEGTRVIEGTYTLAPEGVA